jgi:DNA-binding IclR family transcriptional regulator
MTNTRLYNMEQKEAEKIILDRFDKEESKSALSFKELALVLGEDKKKSKKYLNKMVADGLLKWYHADTVYYERVT